jgi:hypothetical protein
LESSYFCYLGAHAKIWNPTTTPSGVLATAVTRKEKRKEKEIPLTSIWGAERSVPLCGHMSEDPHRRQRNFSSFFSLFSSFFSPPPSLFFQKGLS